MSTSPAKLLVLAVLFVSMAAWSLEPPSREAAAAAAKRDSARCVTRADVDACNDAIRRNPGDPELLVALADALVRARRPADAIRHYRRAAVLAPNMPGLKAKLADAENRLASAPARRTTQPSVRRYSNTAAETQSH